MTVEEFIAACKARGWNFTARWVARRWREMQSEQHEVWLP